MILKTYTHPQFKSKLSFEEKRKSDALVYIILAAIVLILSIIFSV